MKRHIIAFVCLLCLIGCDDRTPDADAGGGADADTRIDAGGGMDAGEDTDAAGGTDAGEATDAGADIDAGGDTDAGGDIDAGGDTDAGPGTDGGLALGDTCEDAIDLTEGGTVTGSTTDATDDYFTDGAFDDCPSGEASGRDRVYVLAPGSNRTYAAVLTPLGSAPIDFDPFLYARTDCAADECVEGTVLNGAGETETITFDVTGGTPAFLIVDGELGTSGDYTLTVTFE